MREKGNARVAERLKLLYQKMNKKQKVTDSDLDRTGWITRQSVCTIKKANGGVIPFNSASQTMALIAVAYRRGYVDEVLEILGEL